MTTTPKTPTPAPVPAPQPVPVPVADRFVWPIERPVITTTFCDPKYHDGTYSADLKGFWHTGIDLNVGGTSGNADAGKAVRAVAAGKVVYCAWVNAGGTWGPMVVIEHRRTNGTVFWTRYAHIGQVSVRPGDIVRAGEQIAVIGLPSNWGARFPAHLHFDWLHTRPSRWSHWPTRGGLKIEVTSIYADPAAKLRALVA